MSPVTDVSVESSQDKDRSELHVFWSSDCDRGMFPGVAFASQRVDLLFVLLWLVMEDPDDGGELSSLSSTQSTSANLEK